MVKLEHPFKVILVPLVSECIQVHKVCDFRGLNPYIDAGEEGTTE